MTMQAHFTITSKNGKHAFVAYRERSGSYTVADRNLATRNETALHPGLDMGQAVDMCRDRAATYDAVCSIEFLTPVRVEA